MYRRLMLIQYTCSKYQMMYCVFSHIRHLIWNACVTRRNIACNSFVMAINHFRLNNSVPITVAYSALRWKGLALLKRIATQIKFQVRSLWWDLKLINFERRKGFEGGDESCQIIYMPSLHQAIKVLKGFRQYDAYLTIPSYLT